MALLALLTLSAFSAINTNTAQAADESSIRGSGKIAIAHWNSIPSVSVNSLAKIDIDVFFAEQLETDKGILSNGIYIKVNHVNQGIMICEPISLDTLPDAKVSWTDNSLTIENADLYFTYNGLTRHRIDITWQITEASDVLSSGVIDESIVTLAPESGQYYMVNADIKISERGVHHVDVFSTDEYGWAIMGNTLTDASAFVTKLNGNKNDLTITIAEFYTSGAPKMTQKTFSINNNAANTYNIDTYKVYVDTKGNDQIRACYIVK